MELHKPAIFDEEAAVADLTKGSFCNKSKTINGLFKIN